MSATIYNDHVPNGCLACRLLAGILDAAEYRHRAFEPWAYDIMSKTLHDELRDVV